MYSLMQAVSFENPNHLAKSAKHMSLPVTPCQLMLLLVSSISPACCFTRKSLDRVPFDMTRPRLTCRNYGTSSTL